MARKKKSSGKPRKKSAGSKRASGASSARKGSSRGPAGRAGKKKARKTSARPAGKKKAAKKKAGKKAAGKKAAGKRAPAKTAKKAKKAARKPARKPAAKKAPARTRSSAKPARRAPARKARGPARDAAFFDHFRRKLIEQRENIVRRLDELRDELRGLEETPREMEEWAQEEKDRDILIRLEDRETDELRKIQAALGLIDQREYGLCQSCGKPIPRARLEELPTAFRCVDCTS